MRSVTFIIDSSSEHRACHPRLARRVRGSHGVKYVLIAEDDPDIAQILSEEIGERLYVATHVVANGALVPEALALRRPDLLILDLALPGLSGLDVFDLVKSDPQWQGVPVLFLTGTPDKLDPTVLIGHRVIAKPFDADELVQAVDEIVDGQPELTARPGQPRLVPAA
jgi:DNA-binding response OmpR family regulator